MCLIVCVCVSVCVVVMCVVWCYVCFGCSVISVRGVQKHKRLTWTTRVNACMIPIFMTDPQVFHHFDMECSCLLDFHHCCHNMLVFRGFFEIHATKKCEGPLARKNFEPKAWSCSHPILALLVSMFAFVPDGSSYNTTNGSPPCGGRPPKKDGDRHPNGEREGAAPPNRGGRKQHHPTEDGGRSTTHKEEM